MTTMEDGSNLRGLMADLFTDLDDVDEILANEELLSEDESFKPNMQNKTARRFGISSSFKRPIRYESASSIQFKKDFDSCKMSFNSTTSDTIDASHSPGGLSFSSSSLPQSSSPFVTTPQIFEIDNFGKNIENDINFDFDSDNDSDSDLVEDSVERNNKGDQNDGNNHDDRTDVNLESIKGSKPRVPKAVQKQEMVTKKHRSASNRNTLLSGGLFQPFKSRPSPVFLTHNGQEMQNNKTTCEHAVDSTNVNAAWVSRITSEGTLNKNNDNDDDNDNDNDNYNAKKSNAIDIDDYKGSSVNDKEDNSFSYATANNSFISPQSLSKLSERRTLESRSFRIQRSLRVDKKISKHATHESNNRNSSEGIKNENVKNKAEINGMNTCEFLDAISDDEINVDVDAYDNDHDGDVINGKHLTNDINQNKSDLKSPLKRNSTINSDNDNSKMENGDIDECRPTKSHSIHTNSNNNNLNSINNNNKSNSKTKGDDDDDVMKDATTKTNRENIHIGKIPLIIFYTSAESVAMKSYERLEMMNRKSLRKEPIEVMSQIFKKVLNKSTTQEAASITNFVVNLLAEKELSFNLLYKTREFIDGMKFVLLDRYFPKILAAGIYHNFETDKGTVDSLAEYLLSEKIIPILQPKLWESAIRETTGENCSLSLPNDGISPKIRQQLLKKLSPSQVGVLDQLLLEDWSAPIAQLNLLKRDIFPKNKVMTLLKCVDVLMDCINTHIERNKSADAKTFTIGADEFVPALLYITIQADNEIFAAEVEYMSLLLDPSTMRGEGGYYLTVLSSCVKMMDVMEIDISQTSDASLLKVPSRRLPRIHDLQSYLKVECTIREFSCTRTYHVLPGMTASATCQYIVEAMKLDNDVNYYLFERKNWIERRLEDNERPQYLKITWPNDRDEQEYSFVLRAEKDSMILSKKFL